jgi:hypothetical protein
MTTELSESNHIYLIQERESQRCNDNVYKIGKTKQQPLKRMNSYPLGSKILIIIIVDDADSAEKALLTIFRKKFKRAEYGNEYFIGDPKQMIDVIINYQNGTWYPEHNVNTIPTTNVSGGEVTIKPLKNIHVVKPVSNPIPKPVVREARTIIGSTVYDIVTLLKASHKQYIKPTSYAEIKIKSVGSYKYKINSINIFNGRSVTSVNPKALPENPPHNNSYIELNKYQSTKFSDSLKDSDLLKITVLSFTVKKLRGTMYYKFTVTPDDCNVSDDDVECEVTDDVECEVSGDYVDCEVSGDYVDCEVGDATNGGDFDSDCGRDYYEM